jgi:dipeptidyl aminopeptidase/acylaminoacyl peptidase
VFSTEVGGESTVVRVTPNGLEVIELVRGSHPAWSPDGQSLAFSCVTEPRAEPQTLGTCISRADGSGQIVLVHDGYKPSFSPDGAYIAYIRGVIDVPDVFVTSVRTPADEQLVGHSAFVRWSPDSERLLLNQPAGSLSIVSRDGAILHALGGYDGAWSPDGGRAALLRIVGTRASLLLADLRNGTLTPTGFATESAPEGIVWLAGDRILFLMDGDLWRLDLAVPAEPVRLTVDLGIDWPTLSPSPDLRWVAFTKTEGQGAGLYLASVDGGWSLLVARSQLRYPDWQPAT